MVNYVTSSQFSIATSALNSIYKKELNKFPLLATTLFGLLSIEINPFNSKREREAL
jgi:hypothetical protein